MKGTLQKLTIFLSSVLVSFILGEFLIRVVATQSVTVRFLSTAGATSGPQMYLTLEDFLSSRAPHIEPNRQWLNYYANKLGFYDQEFKEEKSPDEFRIAAFGDSFSYGLVSYSENIHTKVEENLKSQCNRNITVYNLGIPASGLWEYHTLMDLVSDRWDFDLFVVHFYMGNDGPNLVSPSDDIPKWKMSLFHLYLPTFIKNSLKVLQFTKDQAHAPKSQVKAAIGGTPIKPGLPAEEAKSSFNAEGYQNVLNGEMGRFYRDPRGDKNLRTHWARVYEVLDTMVKKARSKKKDLIIVLHPSRLQIEEETRLNTIAAITKKKPEIDPNAYDINLPSRMIQDYCTKNDLACFDTTDAFHKRLDDVSSPYYIKSDGHWNAAGNHIAAEAESRFLADYVCPKK